jgi:hypothetical protein
MYANDDCLVLANQVSADDEVIFMVLTRNTIQTMLRYG